MKVLLIGCGAVGLGIASALCGGGVRPSLVARGETKKAIMENGIRRTGKCGEACFGAEYLRLPESPAGAGEAFDFICVCVKTTANGDVAASLGALPHILAPGGKLVLFQNGLGNEEAFLPYFSADQIALVSITVGFVRPERNTSEVTAVSAPMQIGALTGGPAPCLGTLAAAIDAGGIGCRVSDSIGRALWSKMLYNCTLNALGALLDTDVGGLARSPDAVAVMKDAIGELFAVMKAGGFSSDWPDETSFEADFFGRALPGSAAHRVSTLQDVERRIPTEIDSINGAVVRYGEKLSVPVTCNRLLLRLIHAKESLY